MLLGFQILHSGILYLAKPAREGVNDAEQQENKKMAASLPLPSLPQLPWGSLALKHPAGSNTGADSSGGIHWV